MRRQFRPAQVGKVGRTVVRSILFIADFNDNGYASARLCGQQFGEGGPDEICGEVLVAHAVCLRAVWAEAAALVEALKVRVWCRGGLAALADDGIVQVDRGDPILCLKYVNCELATTTDRTHGPAQ